MPTIEESLVRQPIREPVRPVNDRDPAGFIEVEGMSGAREHVELSVAVRGA